MNNVFVSFPKANSFYGKSIDEQRVHYEVYKEWLDMLHSIGCNVEYLYEDTLAKDMVSKYEFTTIVKTAFSKSDIQFILVNKNKNIFSEDIIEYVNEGVMDELLDAESCNINIGDKFKVPYSLIKQDKNMYLKKKIESIGKKYKYILDSYIKDKRYVLQFRTNCNTDRGKAVSSTIEESDGRLLIEVNVNDGSSKVYYGGVSLDKEHIPLILSN